MKPKIATFLMAEKVILDSEAKNFSFISVFDNYTYTELPIIVNSFAVFTKIINAKGAQKIEISLTSPSDTQIATIEYSGFNDSILNVTSRFSQIKFEEKGVYNFVVKVDDTILEPLPLQTIEILPSS